MAVPINIRTDVHRLHSFSAMAAIKFTCSFIQAAAQDIARQFSSFRFITKYKPKKMATEAIILKPVFFLWTTTSTLLLFIHFASIARVQTAFAKFITS